MQDIKEQVYGIERQLNTAKKSLKRHKGVSKRNQKLILDFVRFGEAKGLSPHRLLTYIKYMRTFAKIVHVDFDKATRDDMEKAFAQLNRKGYADWTLQTYKDVTKAYWRWLYKLGKRDALPPCVNWIEGQKFPTKLTSEDLLTDEDIQKMILATPDVQRKAIVSVLYETGVRIGEFLQMVNTDVYIADEYVKIRVSGKTLRKNGKRDIFLIKSHDFFTQWFNNHPLKNRKEYPLWITSRGTAIGPRWIGIILKELAEKAGINKKVYPYLFRHSRATILYKTKPAPIVRKLLGHSAKMEAVYTHLSSDDVLEMLVGIKKKDDEIDKKCSRCGHENGFVNDFCSRCGLALTEIAAKSKQIEVKSMVMQFLEEQGHKDIGKVVEVRR